MLRLLTAGESHGPALTAVLDGFPEGLPVDEDYIARDLARRQGGYGRGARQQIERDRAQILGGVHQGLTTGAPIALLIENKDWANWQHKQVAVETVPRPGHAELPGVLKYGQKDTRIVAERASARNSATLVGAGAVARRLLVEVGITVFSQVLQIGDVKAQTIGLPLEELLHRLDRSSLNCADPEAEQAMRRTIDEARKAGDTLGGIFEVQVLGVPPGLGSHVQWDRRLDGRLAQAVMSIMAIKGIEFGAGFQSATRHGTEAHDQIDVADGRLVRRTNYAGGVEGGISNGEPIVLRAAMKPIPTTMQPQRSIDLRTGQPAPTRYQRSDICAVPAAGVVAEAMCAWVIADVLVEKFGADSLAEIKRNMRGYLESLPDFV